MAGLEIVPVERSADFDAFIDLPWDIYADHPNWVPPLKKVVRRMLDTFEHPYWQFSERVLFLAHRDWKFVGRIAAIVDKNYNQYHKTGMGIWGFFECENDLEAAKGLFASAEEWVRGRGMTYLCGPFNPSTNYEIGMLIDGFEHQATFMMPYNPPYYLELAQASGLRKEKDLFSYLVDRSWQSPEWMEKIADRLKNDGRFSVRNANRKTDNVEAIVTRIRQIYDECWAGNWGFVPTTDAEVSELAMNLERFADEDLIFFVYCDEEPIGAALMVPNINPLLKRLNGKIGILGMFKYLLYRREINGVRGLLLGIKKKYQEIGVPFLLLYHALEVAYGKDQYQYLELGWNLEDNHAINQLEADGGAKLFKKYRIFKKTVADRW
ncbi:MAG: acyl-CoA N-acyltransferase [Desulfomonile sp.]